jgi:hypothetical protein
MRAVEVSKVGSVQRLGGTDSGGKEGNVFRMILELGTGGGIPFTKKVGAVTEGFGDNVRSAKTVRELGHSIDGSVTLNLDADHNKVIDGEQRLVAGFVGAFAVVGAAFVGEDSKDFGRESGVRLGKAEKIMDSRDRPVNKGWGLGGESEIEWKLEFATDGGDAADDVSAVDRAGVPGIGGAVDGFDKDVVGAAIVAGNGDAAVENTKEALNAHGFVVAASSRMEFQFEQRTHGFEEAAKSTAGVDDNNTSETNFEEKLLHENVGEIGGGYVGDAFDDDHTSKVAHGSEDVSGTVRNAGRVAGLPKINMKDVKRAAHGPRVQEFAMATDSVVGKEAVGALLNPIEDVHAKLGPEEAKADAMQSLVFLCVSCSGRGMVGREDVAA